MKIINNFSDNVLTQIKWWAWAAAVLPITALAGLFFIWAFGFDNLYDKSMVIGATAMFAIATAWWWWVLWVLSKMLKKEQRVFQDLDQARYNLKEIRAIIKETLFKDK